MKREIKFRIFDKKIKKIFKAHDLRFTAEEAVYQVCHDTITENGGKNFTFTDFKEVILMQFTGLKDVNVKEIYEGDILEFPFELGIAYVINDGFRFAVKSPGSQAIDYESQETLQQSKIIGNIYENPELIESLTSLDNRKLTNVKLKKTPNEKSTNI